MGGAAVKQWGDEQDERKGIAGRLERAVFAVLIGMMLFVTLASLFRAI